MLRLASARIVRFHYLHKALEFGAAKHPNHPSFPDDRHAERSEASTRIPTFPTLSSFNQAVSRNENLTLCTHRSAKDLVFGAAKLPNRPPLPDNRHCEKATGRRSNLPHQLSTPSIPSTRITAFLTLSSINKAVPHNENLTQSLLCLAERSEASTRTYKRSIPSNCNRSVSQHYNMTTITTLVPLTILKSPLLPCGRGAPTPTPGPRTPGVRVLIHPSNASLTSFLRSAPILAVYAPLPAPANLLITRSIYDDKDNWN